MQQGTLQPPRAAQIGQLQRLVQRSPCLLGLAGRPLRGTQRGECPGEFQPVAGEPQDGDGLQQQTRSAVRLGDLGEQAHGDATVAGLGAAGAGEFRLREPANLVALSQAQMGGRRAAAPRQECGQVHVPGAGLVAAVQEVAQLDRVLKDPDAVLASNTSSISILGLARATADGGRVIGMHFFSPVPALPLVEMVSTPLTDEKTAVRAEEFVTGVLGKRIIRSPDRAGFTVNALLVPYLLSAVRMVESGHVSADTVDDAMTLGCSHPMGPLRLADLIGLDVVASIADTLHEEFREPHYAPPPLLRRLVETGMLGRKTGQGFHHYDR